MTLRPVSLAVMLMLAGLTTSAAADATRRSYIVQLADKPVATYTGQVVGLAATKPAPGQRLNVDAADVQNYVNYLETRQSRVLGTVDAAQVTHKYNLVFNGFAAMLTAREVRALKKNSGVAKVSPNTIMRLHTNFTPTFLGLDKAGGLWEQLGGQAGAGEDIVIGILDSGIWPENPAFADRVDANGVPSHTGATLAYGPPPASWKGSCDTGEGFAVSNCNNKLIGARYFKSPSQTLHWADFNSARDAMVAADGGHGTHTASTAGGNANTPARTNGLSLGRTSGMAPRARIAAYKVCWADEVSGQVACGTSDSVAAIEQAVKDGVNVINFSIGGPGGDLDGPNDVAFLGAASAGVFIAASAGNDGPSTGAPAPTSHINPWVTTVGNSSHNRSYVASATLGNGVKLSGASGNASTASAPLILARDAGLPEVAPTNPLLLQCFGPADEDTAPLLDPAKVAGKILVCDRGANELINKSLNGKWAGAAGVIIANVNVASNVLFNVPHMLSTLQLTIADATTLKDYVAANPGKATASLGGLQSVINPDLPVPVMDGTSSRGPNVANPNILKPDLVAPGSNILAGAGVDLGREQRDAIAIGGAAPEADSAIMSGTSMASPHVAGLAALLKQLHPSWSPAAIKSALMTTATDTKPDGVDSPVAWDGSARATGTLPWAQGAGHVTPNSAARPGLVYDAGEIDYARFLCGLNIGVHSAATCQEVGTIQPYNLNLASLTAADVVGILTLNRTVTNVGATTATYNATASVPGYTVEVQPPALTIGAGQKASFKVKLTRTTAAFDTWAYGSLVWSDGATTVRSPLTVRGTALAVPALVSSELATSSKLFTIGTGFTGKMTSVKSGLLPATVKTTRKIGQTPATDASEDAATCRAGGGEGVNAHNVPVPAGTMVARFALFNEDTSGGEASDLDLIVIAPDDQVLESFNAGSNERVNLVSPAAGTYKVCVVGVEPVDGRAEYKLSSWVLAPGAVNGGFKALPPSNVYLGGTGTVVMSWAGLAPNQRHLGALRYVVNGVTQGLTMVEVDTKEPVAKVQAAQGAAALAD